MKTNDQNLELYENKKPNEIKRIEKYNMFNLLESFCAMFYRLEICTNENDKEIIKTFKKLYKLTNQKN